MNVKRLMQRILSCVLILAFLVSDVRVYAQGATQLPAAVPRIELSPAFTPAIVRGIKVYPGKPFQFDFIVDSADSGLKDDELKAESEKLIRYFLASLTVPDNDLWVNLSPYEKDRIVPDELGKTEMGRDMLAQDYLLKQITASLTNPESDIGKQFWQKVYARAYEKYGAIDVPTDTFNKVWIMPQKADVYVKDDRVFIIKSRLKVMLDEDYVAAFHQRDAVESRAAARELEFSQAEGTSAAQNTFASDIVREVFIPVLEKEVNEGRNFAQVRQIYHSLILAFWYKTALKDSILNKVYSDRRKVQGVDLSDEGKTQKIYARYLDTFNKGVVNMVKDEYDPYTQQTIPRKYFAGGVVWERMHAAMNYVATVSSELPVWTSASTLNSYKVNFVSVDQAMSSPADQARALVKSLNLSRDSRVIIVGPGTSWFNYEKFLAIQLIDQPDNFALWEKLFLETGAQVIVYEPNIRANRLWQERARERADDRLVVLPVEQANFEQAVIQESSADVVVMMSVLSDQQIHKERMALFLNGMKALKSGGVNLLGYYNNRDGTTSDEEQRQTNAVIKSAGYDISGTLLAQGAEPPNLFMDSHDWVAYRVDKEKKTLGGDPVRKDQTMAGAHKEGGIDFKTGSIPLNAQGQAIDLAMPADLENLKPEDVPGLIPVIINVTPVSDFHLLLGLSQATQR